jgi:hypothetical protein
MRAPRGYNVDHPLGRVSLAQHADGPVGRVEGWTFGAARVRAPLGYHVDHPLGRVGLAEHADGPVGRVEGWALGAARVRTLSNHFFD